MMTEVYTLADPGGARAMGLGPNSFIFMQFFRTTLAK